jgi:prevent-host-death family protein
MVDGFQKIGKIMPMKDVSMPIGRARSELCELVKKVQRGGIRVTLTSHGRPAAVIVPPEQTQKPRRVAVPTNPELFGDLQSPVMDDWQ